MRPPMSILSHRDAGDLLNLSPADSESLVNTAHFDDLSRSWLPSPLLVLQYLRLIAQHGVEQRTVNLDFAVVVDEALFAEFVHEEADPGARGADHFGQGFLTECDRDRLAPPFLAQIREQQQPARAAAVLRTST